MPPLPFAVNFLAGSLLTLLVPALLLIAVVAWFALEVKRVPADTPESALALPSREVLAAGVEAGIEGADAEPTGGQPTPPTAES
jgi:hypothetical protein